MKRTGFVGQSARGATPSGKPASIGALISEFSIARDNAFGIFSSLGFGASLPLLPLARRIDAKAARYVSRAERRPPQALTVLRGDAAPRLLGIHRLQPHVPPDRLRRSRARVLEAPE